MRKQSGVTGAVVAILLLLAVPACFGQVFSNDNHGSRAVGRANAFTASASDASAIWYNPAGLTQLAGTHVYAGGSGLSHNLEYFSEFYQDTYHSDNALVPSHHFYISSQLTNHLWAGLGFGMPVNHLLDWGDDPEQHAVRNVDRFRVYSYAVSPCLSFAVSENISVGLGVHYLRSHITLAKWDRIEIENLALQELGITVTDYYLQHEYNVSSSGLALFGGLRARLSDKLVFGFAYQGGHPNTYTGTLDFRHEETEYTDLDPLVEAAFPDGDATLHSSTMVDQFTVGLALIPNSKFEFEVDYNYKLWSSQEQWEYTLSEPVLQEDLSYSSEGMVPLNWVNSGSLRFGGTYHVSPLLETRAGFSITESPVPDQWLMTPFPDSRHWSIHLGAGYAADNWTVDLGYVHRFYDERVNLDWYGMRLAGSRGSVVSLSLGRRFW